MPEHALGRSSRDRFDVSVDEGTFGGYEAFGVYKEGSGKGRVPEYEIFIVRTGQEVRGRSVRRPVGPPSRSVRDTYHT